MEPLRGTKKHSMEPPWEKKKQIIVVCGGLNWNMISVGNRLPKAGETLDSKSFDMFPGGKGANTAIALHRLSHVKPKETQDGVTPRNICEGAGCGEIEVRMVGSVGDDKFGDDMRESLEKHFINIKGVRRQPNSQSAVAVTWVEAGTGENRVFVFPGANRLLKEEEFEDITSFGTPTPDLVVSQLELHRDTVHRLLSTAKKAGIDTLLNPSPAHHLPYGVYNGLTHLVLNETEAEIMMGKTIDEMTNGSEVWKDWYTITDFFLAKGVQYVVVTLGPQGALCSKEKGKVKHVEAETVEQDDIKDTSGAGLYHVEISQFDSLALV